VPQSEWQALLPADAKPGDTIGLPTSLRNRLLCIGLSNRYTGGFPGNPWEPNHIQQGELGCTVEKITPEESVLRLNGTAKLGGFRVSKQQESWQEARIKGVIRYDLRKKAFTCFDIVAVGDYWGSWGSQGKGYEAFDNMRPRPMGYFLELATEPWEDRAPFTWREQLAYSRPAAK
jgi:hypothetical protein